MRDRLSLRCKMRLEGRYIWRAMHALIDGSMRILYKCFPVILRRPDASICHYLSSSDKCVYIGVTATSSAVDATQRARSPSCARYRSKVLQGPLLRSAVAVLQTAAEYRLLAATADKPNVSHSFVSKSDRKQAAGCHLALVVLSRFVARRYLALTDCPLPSTPRSLCPSKEGSFNKRISE